MADCIGILGAGNMGKGLALLFAMRGFDAILYTRDLSREEAIRGSIANNVDLLFNNSVIDEKTAESVRGRISLTDKLETLAGKCELIIENVLENLAIKREHFAKLDALSPPSVILASNTSAISITEIAEGCSHKDRVIGTHFWNPPFLIPLVEIIKTEHTNQGVVSRTVKLMEKAKKVPVIAQKDVPGFIANRLQHALQREALNIVARGIASPEDVDKSIKYGFGMRLGICPPLEVIDMGGTDLTLSIHKYLFPDLYNEPVPVKILEEMVARGDLGFKTGKGIRKWSPGEVEASQAGLTKDLIAVMRALDRL